MKAGFLNNKCVKCLKIIGSLENYGTTENPLCFDCASKVKCDLCGDTIPLTDQYPMGTQKICRDCLKITQYEDSIQNKQVNDASDLEPSDEAPVIELPDIPLPMVFKIKTDPSRLAFFSIVMLLPSLGGFLEIFHVPFKEIGGAHVLCLILYILYPLIVSRILARNIVLYNDYFQICGFIFKKHIDINTLERIDEVTSPKSAVFVWEKMNDHVTYLELYGVKKIAGINVGGIKNYKNLRDYLIVKSGCAFGSVHKKRGLIHWFFGI